MPDVDTYDSVVRPNTRLNQSKNRRSNPFDSFFGRSNSTRQWRYIELGFRTKTNEQLRQEYTEEVNSVLEGLGLTIPDPMANRHFV